MGILITILLIALLFKGTGLIFRICGKIIGFCFGIIGYAILGVLAVTVFSVSLVFVPVIVVAAIGTIIWAIVKIAS